MNKKILIIAAFALVILLAAFARFYHLAGHGLSFCDAFIYITTAKQWFFYHSHTNTWAKPGYYLLGCLAIAFLGVYDYTLLYLNSAMDIINILLLILIGFKIGMRQVFVLSAAIIYAFLPSILKECTSGLPHLPSTTFFLASFYVFLIYFNAAEKPAWLLFLTGLLIVFAGQVHPMLFCGAIFYGLVLFGMSIKRPGKLIDLLVYCLGCLSIFVALTIFMSDQDSGFVQTLTSMINTVISHRQIGVEGHQGNLWLQAGFVLGGLSSLMSIPFVIFFGGIGLVFLTVKFKSRFPQEGISKASLSNLFLLGGCLINFLLINLVTVIAWQDRLLIPAVPFIVLLLTALVDRFALAFPEEWHLGRKFLIAVTFITFCNTSSEWVLLMKKPPKVYKQMANVLYHKVDDEHRLLIAPSFFFGPIYLEMSYFDAYNLYRVKGPWEPDLSLLQAYHIKYVAITKDLNNGKADADSFFSSDLAGKTEYFLMYRGLNSMRAKCLFDSDQLSIFEIPIRDSPGSPHATPNDLPFFNIGYGPNNNPPFQLYQVGVK